MGYERAHGGREVIQVKGVSHRFDERWVLRSIDLEVQRGEVLAIMGTSGGGKTTLLRIVGALLRPTEGDVLVDGISAIDRPEAVRAKIGLVFQSAALFDYLNVEENVLFGVQRRRRLSRTERSELTERLLAQVALKDAARLMPAELSGGMRKRVGLARALAMEPEVLLYDEPTSGLDPVTAYSIDELIASTGRDLNVTSVVVSHDVTSIFRVADRIAFLAEGHLRFVGTPDEFEQSFDTSIRELVEKSQTRTLL